MSGKFFFILLLAPASFAFKDGRTDPPALRDLYRTYSRSDRLYSLPNATEASNQEALAGFRQVTDALPRFTRNRETDSVFFQSLYKSGVLYELAGDYNRATWSYLHAITLAPDAANRGKMDVFTGAGYYNLNNFDSASYFLLRAEEDGKGQLAVEDRVRLYNTLGVLFYDNGNYLQAKNYFNRGLMLLQQQPEPDKLSLLSVRLNMATCYYRLNLFDEALAIYRQAIQEKVFPDQIYMNMGRAYAGLHRHAEALSAFRRVDQKRLPWVLNEMARVEMESGRTDSAAYWLARFRKTESRFSTNKIDSGINMLYSGELDLSLSNSAAALQHLQQAIILFSGNFNDTTVRHNPAVFTGTFTYYRLFDALSRKSLAWEQQYKKTANPEDLLSALDAYRSTISLLTYIERSYEMDDAKILLKQKSATVYQHAVSVCLKLDSLFPNRRYLEEAFVISERSKASVMASNLREENFHFVHRENDSLIRTERNIKFNIARLSIEAEQTPDALEKINAERSVYESELAIVQKKLERDSRYYQLKYQEDYPSVQRLQESLQKSQALISISNEDASIQVFVVTSDGFHHLQLNAGDSIRRAAMEWIHYLQSAESERHTAAMKWQQQLYRLLIKSLEQIAGDRKEWILVPDGLFFL
ncbi:MAG TPA: tetratricopeptide repeat protein, partial [Puia sp.]|nr:tetratricopeptide repeat protein [Puia sp.]